MFMFVVALASPAKAAAPAKVTWTSDCDGAVRTVTALALLPVPLDVCGSLLPDVVATWTPRPSGAQMRVVKLLHTPLRLQIRATAGSLSAGFDARASDAPSRFAVDLTSRPANRDAVYAFQAPGQTIDVSHADGPRKTQISLTGVPTRLRTTTSTRSLHLESATPTTIDLREENGAATTRARVDKLPSTLDIGLTATGMTHRAATTVGDLRVDADDPAGLIGRATSLRLSLESVPAEVDLDLTAPAFSAGATIGSLDVTLSGGDASASLPSGRDGIVLRDTGTGYAVAARVRQLRQVFASVGALRVETSHASGFLLDMVRGDQAFLVEAADRPALVDLSIVDGSAGGARLRFAASATVNQLQIHGANLPLASRAKTLRLQLAGLPTSVTMDVDVEGVRTDGARIDSVDALLTSGPVDSVPAGSDGLVLRDVPDRYVVAARLTGLRQVSVAVDPLPHMAFDLSGGRTLDIDSRIGTRFLTLRLPQAPAGGRLTFTDKGFEYAGGRAASLAMSTNVGRSTFSTVVTPVPASLAMCLDRAANTCGNTNLAANGGSLRVVGSEHTMVNLVDDGLRLTNLFVRKLEVNNHVSETLLSGSAWFDTDNFEVRGILEMSGDERDLRADLPEGTLAQDRQAQWSAFVTDTQGSMTCPSGLSYTMTVSGVAIGLRQFLC